MPSFSRSRTEKMGNTSCVCLQTVTYATSEMGRFGGQTAMCRQCADGHTSLPRTGCYNASQDTVMKTSNANVCYSIRQCLICMTICIKIFIWNFLAHCGWHTILKTAMTRMRAVVAMVRVMRGQGLLAMIPDDRRSHSQDAEAVLLQCYRGKVFIGQHVGK